jgi:hypothetical protein
MQLLRIEPDKKTIDKIAKKELLRLASSINTLWGHAKANGYPIAIITAFRGYMTKRKKRFPRYSYAENLRRNEKLKEKLQELPVSFVPVQGSFIEGYNTPRAHRVEERAFFVIGNLMPESEFKKAMMDLAHTFNQDAIAYKPANEDIIYGVGTQDYDEEGYSVKPGYGIEEAYGRFHPSQIGDFYSKLKGHPFTFTAVVKDLEGKAGCAFRAFLKSGGEMYDEFGNVIYSGVDEKV